MKGVLLSLVTLALVPAPSPAAAAAPATPAAETKLRDLAIVIAGGQVLVSFHLDGGFLPEVSERMESGLPTGFGYELVLSRDRQWFDATVAKARLDVIAMFNAVTREFLVNTKLDGKLIDSQTLRDRDDLARAMTRFEALPVFTLAPSAQRARYLVRARVEVGTTQMLGFIPVLRTSDWAESNRVRLR